MLRCVRVKVGESPEVVEIDGSLESLQREVGGFVEAVRFSARFPGTYLLLNENGNVVGLPFNRWFGHWNIVGDALIVKGGDEDFISFSEDECRAVVEWLGKEAA